MGCEMQMEQEVKKKGRLEGESKREEAEANSLPYKNAADTQNLARPVDRRLDVC